MREIYLPSYKAELAGAYLPEREFKKYANLVRIAKDARAYPDQSGFFVRTAGIAKDGTTSSGGNKEYGLSDAYIHGETAVLSALSDLTDSPVEAIAWYQERQGDAKISPSDFGRPCGNCRDIMSAYCGPDLVLLNGNETGIVYTHLSDFLFSKFNPIKASKLGARSLQKALAASDMGINSYLPDRLKTANYGAVLVSEDGNSMWSGFHYTNAGYDSVTPVMSAIINWKNSYPYGEFSSKHLRLGKLVIAGRGENINPFYRDRQAILELDEILRRFKGVDKPLRVEIVESLGRGRVNSFETDVNEWLPNPFSAGVFGMENVLTDQMAKLVGPLKLKSFLRRT